MISADYGVGVQVRIGVGVLVMIGVLVDVGSGVLVLVGRGVLLGAGVLVLVGGTGVLLDQEVCDGTGVSEGIGVIDGGLKWASLSCIKGGNGRC